MVHRNLKIATILCTQENFIVHLGWVSFADREVCNAWGSANPVQNHTWFYTKFSLLLQEQSKDENTFELKKNVS